MSHLPMIGVFDSGVGGLSVLQEIRKALPQADFVYFGDTANVPYGGRPDNEIKRLSEQALQVLLTFSPDLIVVACNTATSIAINQLRLDHVKLPIVGVVPVLKTAAKQTRTHKIAVLATLATLSSQSYAMLKEQFARNLNVLELSMPEWVLFVERGDLDSQNVVMSVYPVAARVGMFGADVIVLGCTHFPFLCGQIEQALPGVTVLDSGPAVARQVMRVLNANGKLPDPTHKGSVQYTCSGNVQEFERVAGKLLGETVQVEKVG